MRRIAAATAAVLALSGCTAAYDDDGEFLPTGSLSATDGPAADATPVVVDTDLAAEDLAALAFLLRRSDVRVVGVTIAGTGLVGCDPGADLVADLIRALGESWVPIACGREDAARPWPAEWRELAARAPGLPRWDTTLLPVSVPAPRFIARLADTTDGLQVVALGPLTNLADLAEQRPDSYRRLAGITAMGGAVDVPSIDGVAEWNAAADPAAMNVVLAGPAPLTVVPDDPIPAGNPAALDAPVVGPIAANITIPKWWDTTTVAALVTPGAVSSEPGTWTVDATGRLSRTGSGSVVAVVTALDKAQIDATLEATFG